LSYLKLQQILPQYKSFLMSIKIRHPFWNLKRFNFSELFNSNVDVFFGTYILATTVYTFLLGKW